MEGVGMARLAVFVHHMVAKSLAVGWSPLVGHAWVILGYLGWRAAGPSRTWHWAGLACQPG